MPHIKDPLLVFTDLDGTLLDPHTHQWDAAQDWLSRLINQRIPIVLTSSKNAAEISTLQEEMGLEGLPFIAENGAVIQLDERWHNSPDYPRLLNGLPHDEIVSLTNQLREAHGYKFYCFEDVDDNTLAGWTGLTPRMVTLARLTEASQTLIWRDSDDRLLQFEQQLASVGLLLLEGGRFWHVIDACGGKGQAVNWICEQYRQREEAIRTTIGLGDGPNDTALLDAVDYAVVVKGLNRKGIVLKHNDPQRVYFTQHGGPAGWSEGLAQLLTLD